ncbi:MAG: restriction endonuclease [Rhodobacteraceae bacterium]|nr:restriction endonuclease [Paracoccaceae bacterium]
MELTISKVLSANDSGETGGHQAGLLIPKKECILSFFPALNESELNPRAHLHFEDDAGQYWEFAFIYYNNRLFGGTRNEYRLTRMTRYIRELGLVTGDEVLMNRDSGGNYSISYRRSSAQPVSMNEAEGTVIRLGAGWKVVNI